MKKNTNNLPFLVCMIILLSGAGCKKATVDPSNDTLIVNAGADITKTIPDNYAVLTAVISGGNKIKEYKWKKISGPASIYINENGLTITPVWLEEGVYEFEFTATDNRNLSARDTVKVTIATQLQKHIVKDITLSNSGFVEIQLPQNVFSELKWVFCKASNRYERVDAGAFPNMNYSWDGYYYELLPDNRISVYGGYTGYNIDVIIYY